MPTPRRSPLASLACLVVAGCEPVPPPTIPEEDVEAVCYDTFDNDEDGAIDCLDSSCAEFPTCCVGAGTEACCDAPGEILAVSLAACADAADPAACAPELDPYGAPAVVDGALAGGPGPLDSGALLPSPLDAAGSRYRITFEGATGTSCPSGCLNYAAVGLASVDAPRVLDLPVAVVLRPGLGDMALFSYGEVLQSWSIEPGFHRYALDLGPTGSVAVSEIDATGATVRELVPEFERGAPFDEPTWLAVAGRADGIAPGELPARIRSVEVSRAPCDMPQRALPEPEPVIPLPGSPEEAVLVDVDGVGRAANAAGAEVVVIDAGDGFHLFRAGPTGRYVPTGSLAAPFVTAAALPAVTATGLDDPWLVADEAAGRWQLYFTVRTGRNASSIGRISSGPGFAEAFDLATFRIVAEPDAAFPKLEQPTVAGDRMIVRGASADLGMLVRLVPDGPDRWVPDGDELADGQIHQPHFDDLFAMDRDAVADPALVEVDGVYRLLFAGRRGTRWSVGLLVSLGGEHWHQPLGPELPVWEDDGAGFDALAARDPVAWEEDGMLRVLYVGEDGVTGAVGRATSGTTTTWPVP